MQEVLKQLQKELEKAQTALDLHEARRDTAARGSYSWQFENNAAQYYGGEVNGIKRAIWVIERAGATI